MVSRPLMEKATAGPRASFRRGGTAVALLAEEAVALLAEEAVALARIDADEAV